MEMHQVRYFVMLCETLNFTRAAERCNVSQPSLTRAIKLLEDELGGPLFNRERNNTHLTELGRVMEPHLREALVQAQTARARASAFFELRTSRLKLGLSRGVGLTPVDQALERFATTYPDAEIVLLDDHAPKLRAALLEGELEVVVLPQRPQEVDELHYYPIGADRLQVLVRPDHRFTTLNGVPMEALAQETLICRDGCQLFNAVEHCLHEKGIAVRPKVTVGAEPWMAALVRKGLGIGVTGTLAGVPEGLVGRALSDLAFDRDINLVTKRGRLYSPPVKAFVEIALKARTGAPIAAPAAA